MQCNERQPNLIMPQQKSVAVALNVAQKWLRGVSKKDFLVGIERLNLDEESMASAKNWLSYISEGKLPFEHPKYWSAFCATGC